MATLLYRESDPVWHLLLVAMLCGIGFTVGIFGLWELVKQLRLPIRYIPSSRGGHR